MTWVHLFRHQFGALVRGRRLIGLGLLAALPGLILLIVGLAEESTDGEVVAGVAEVSGLIFPIAALMLAAGTLRDERDDGTLPYIYSKPISRLTLAVTSILAAAVATVTLALIATASITLASALTGVDLALAVQTLPLFAMAAIGYSAVFVPSGYLIPRIVLVGLGYVIVWEQIVAHLVTGVANTSIWRFAVSIYADFVPDNAEALAGALGPVEPGAGGGMAKLAAVLVIGLLLLTWALRRRDAV